MLQILSPELEQRIDFSSFPTTGEITVRIQGNLDLVPEGSPNVGGSGYLELAIDDKITKLTEGPLTSGLRIDTQIEPTAGGHRLAVQAFHPDGVPFRNEGALATSLFWLDDGEPHVTVLQPWPGQSLPLRTPPLPTEIATINFQITPATGDTRDEALGHAHIHYDQDFPSCSLDPECDPEYLAILAPIEGGPRSRFTMDVPLPDSPEATATVTAVLRNNDHSLYLHPFVQDEAERESTNPGKVIFDTITIQRVGEP